jgi:hypothetical protein
MFEISQRNYEKQNLARGNYSRFTCYQSGTQNWINLRNQRRIKAEKQLMQVLPKEIHENWDGYFIFEETCPQTQMSECPINSICEYYKIKKGKVNHYYP